MCVARDFEKIKICRFVVLDLKWGIVFPLRTFKYVFAFLWYINRTINAFTQAKNHTHVNIANRISERCRVFIAIWRKNMVGPWILKLISIIKLNTNNFLSICFVTLYRYFSISPKPSENDACNCCDIIFFITIWKKCLFFSCWWCLCKIQFTCQ